MPTLPRGMWVQRVTHVYGKNTVRFSHFLSPVPPANTSTPGGQRSITTMGLLLFPCDKCGKVCKSIRGLSQHSLLHRESTELVTPIRHVRHEFHPFLNGNKLFPRLLFAMVLITFKERPAIVMAIFSYQELCRHHHNRSKMTTGPLSHPGRDLNLLKSYILKPTSPKASSINFWISGVRRLFPMATFPLSPITETSRHR